MTVTHTAETIRVQLTTASLEKTSLSFKHLAMQFALDWVQKNGWEIITFAPKDWHFIEEVLQSVHIGRTPEPSLN